MDLPALRRRLLAWYDAHQRPLPWRGPGVDVYATWVSEAMLQQTRVDVATPYYLRWMARFPTLDALARAPPDDVLQAWAGLGYYSRARNLHAAARLVAATGWPTTLAEWRALPGVGPYTAAAIASIAQGQPHACVDGNVVRVVARLTNDGGDVGTQAGRQRIAAQAQRMLAVRRPGDWNQAMMDLGATICLPRAPKCGACPVAAWCAAKAAGTQDGLPNKAKARRPRDEHRRVAVIERAGRILFVRQPAGLLQGLWSLPGGAAGRSLAQHVRQQAGIAVRPTGTAHTARHQFSHRTWHMQVQRAQVLAKPAAAPPGRLETRWIARSELGRHAIPAAAKVALAAVGIASGPPRRSSVTPTRPKTKPKTRPASARP